MPEPPVPPAQPRGPADAAELAALAQVDEAFVHRLLEVGILHAGATGYVPGDVWRVRILRAVEDSGVSMEAIARASVTQDFDFSFLDHLLPEPSPLSGRRFDDLTTELGDLGVQAAPVSEQLGLGVPGPDVPTLAQDDAMLAAFLRQWGADPDIALRAARLVGQTTQRFAEGWAGLHYELYRSLLGPDRTTWSMADNIREGQAARAAVELGMAVLPWMVLHHVERLLAADVVENVLTAVGPFAERIQDPEAGARLPTVAFVDISGYTALTETAGNQAAARATSRFEHAVTVGTAANAGRVVKLLGDGALLLFADADPCASAVRAVVAIREELRAHDLHPHTGIDRGPVVERDGDIFGRTVNLAARLASLATADQIVVSDAVATGLGGAVLVAEPGSAAEPGPAVELEALGEVALKGIDRRCVPSGSAETHRPAGVRGPPPTSR